MTGIGESHVEEAALAWLSELGYAIVHGQDIGPDAAAPERTAYSDVMLIGRLDAALSRLNPELPREALAEAKAKVLRVDTQSLVHENRRLHRFLIEGVPIEVRRVDGTISGEYVRLLDFSEPAANDWLAVNQFTVVEDRTNRRPDVVIFVNGLCFGME